MFPPPEVRRDLASVIPGARSSKWHITLAFLGDADPAVVASSLAGRSFGPSFRLRLAGGGRFDAVVWAGVAGDLDALHELHARLKPDDPREFKPHLTVSYRFSRSLLNSLSGYKGPSWEISSFQLTRSVAGSYSPLALLPLDSNTGDQQA
ncbi:RNA 2',3'-cyclic phosphodiesterase [Actinoplanes sp. OR16]|uniref:2'-5' RNA ligase family protein n=1 Tax=Actinoplanes sp. OR16 TaxID=946334 RepID=UPI000F6F1E80|nr:2'-5' RNA ligase family protein [Actinoplanes sp. OR16]BBH65777.1 RNA 2',3'-cyclic phosphodiesterase [Actinoplanes sp. OR16]